MNFYIPQSRRELINWLSKRYLGKMTGFHSMHKSQLLAIYISTRKREV